MFPAILSQTNPDGYLSFPPPDGPSYKSICKRPGFTADGKKILANAEEASKAAVDEFFADMDKDLTLSKCQDVYGKNPKKVKKNL